MEKEQLLSRRGLLTALGSSVAFSESAGASSSKSYTRKYEPLDEPAVDIGAVYIPFLGSKWGKCVSHRPSVGQYHISESQAVNRHIDQMQGHGISTLMFNFGEAEPDFERFRDFQDAELSSEIDLEAFYVLNRPFQRDLDIDRYLDFMREEMLKLENYNQYEGRPIVQCWAAAYLHWHSPTRNQIQEEYGSLESFIQYVRNRLSIGERDPYLVAHMPNPARHPDYARAFDGYTAWFGPLGRLGQPSWEEFYSAKVEIAERILSFANENKRDYLPMAVPGFDERRNSCWGEDRHVPRSPDHLHEMLEFGDKYRTSNRINLGTFNGWPEGHQIEPGKFNGTDYGTSYLEAVETFQSQAALTETPIKTSTQTPTAVSSVEETPQTTEMATSANATETPEADVSTSGPGLGLLDGIATLCFGGYHYLSKRKPSQKSVNED